MLVVDDHRVFSDLFSLALDATADLACAGRATSIADGVSRAAAEDPDVVVLDVHLPDGDGVAAIRAFREVSERARIVVLTAHPRSDLAREALAAGAVAFLAKDGRLDDLLRAVRTADRRHPVVAEGMRDDGTIALTAREREVLRLLAGGTGVSGIAATLSLSVHTVRDHVKSIRAKLGAPSQLDAITRALAIGLLEPRSLS